MNKTCTKCGDEKCETDFPFKNKEKGLRHSSCKDCQKQASKLNYFKDKAPYRRRNTLKAQKKLAYLQQLKADTPCKDCGNQYPHYVMEFDHVEDKVECVARLTRSGWSKIHAEIAKCDIVCANCHNTRTWLRRECGCGEVW